MFKIISKSLTFDKSTFELNLKFIKMRNMIVVISAVMVSVVTAYEYEQYHRLVP